MGRILKRVPLDFAWPINQVWKGYISPYQPVECNACHGRGYSVAYAQLVNAWYGYLTRTRDRIVYSRQSLHDALQYHLKQDDVEELSKHNCLQRFTVRRTTGTRWKWWKRTSMTHAATPTAAEVNRWSRHASGLDGLDSRACWVVVRHRLRQQHQPLDCRDCKGKGSFWPTTQIAQAARAWKRFDPPRGPGYQLWETTTEGSPLSPVFRTRDELATWAAEHATIFGDDRATKMEWLTILTDRPSPSSPTS